MPFTAYAIGMGTATPAPHHRRDAFREMRDWGFDGVALSFSEGEVLLSRRDFDMQIRDAHAAGLKVHVVPSRLGGRFAGLPVASLWLSENSTSQLPENAAFACVEDPAFREWTADFIRMLFSDHELDGLIWDEPKYSSLVTRHPATLAKLGPSPTPEDMADSFIEFVSGLTAIAREARPQLEVSLFNMPLVKPYFTSRCAFIEGLDYLGFDGACSLQSRYHEPASKMKHYLIERWERTVAECAAGGKKTFALIENFWVPESAISEFYETLEAYLVQAHPDHLSCYYYGFNNDCPEEFQRRVMAIVNAAGYGA